MCWIGFLVGAFIGNRLRLGPVGALLCSALGGYVEFRIRAERRHVRSGGRRSAAQAPDDGALDDAYRTLGVRRGASMSEARRAYREKAKACHPDALRARGATESQIAEATEQMARINAAWGVVLSRRGK